ncbi:TonB-dependent receptor [Novosphingobium sp.]|uniref:TonB-dependent receptor n=1 Tax=Novosphingobium sp. TaxID=1874826 RepID=UPI00333F48C5
MKTSTQMLKFGLFAGSALFALTGTAHAEQAAAPAAASAPIPGEIIVTAQRRDQSIQDVPFTLQALSADTLSKLNVTTFNDLLKFTPNVTFGNNGPGQGAIFMRGLSAGFAGEQSAGTIGGFPNVAIYLDDQSMQFPAHNADVYIADIERVEVLEGPQGTLFGGGAQAGVVRYITAKPKLSKFEAKMEGSFSGTAGGAPNAAFNAMINLPIVKDKLAVRAVIYDDHHGGYIDNVYSTFTRQPSDIGSYYLAYGGNGNQLTPAQQSNGGQYNNASMVKKSANPVDYIGGRVELGWNIAPDWNLLLTESYQKIDASGSFASQDYSYDSKPLGKLQATLFEPNFNKDDYWNTAWTLDGKVGDFKVIYTGAYMARHISTQGDYTNYARAKYGIFYQCTGGANYYWNVGKAPYCYAPNAYWTDQIRTTHQSHEFRVTTPEHSRIRAIAGLYYESLKIQDNNDWDYKTIPSCDPTMTAAAIKASGSVCLGLIAPNPAATLNVKGPRGPLVAFGEDTQRGYKQYAAFGSVDFDVTPQLTLTGGTRYYNYKEYETGSVYSSFNGACYQVPVCVSGSNLDALGLKISYHGFKSKAVISWKPQEHTLVYGLFSQGFRPGGFNRGPSARVPDPIAPHAPQLLVPASYKPDSLTNWEIGFKTDLFDRKVQLNVSSYYMIWQDTQLGFFNPAGGYGNTAFGTNGPNYHIKGAEVQIVARPVTGLTVQGSATYNDSKQSNAPCFIANNPGVSSFGKCITEVYVNKTVKPVSSPFGAVGGITPFSPHVQANARARYDWAAGGDMNWFVAGGISYTSSMYNEPATYPSGYIAAPADPSSPNVLNGQGVIVPGTTVLRYKMPGYATLDASIGFTRDNWSVTIYGENLSNSHASSFTTSAEYLKTQIPIRPLIYGVKVGTKF